MHDATMRMNVRRERRACVLRARGNKGEDTMDEEATANMVQVCGYMQRRGARVRERVRLWLACSHGRSCMRVRRSERNRDDARGHSAAEHGGWGLAWMDRLLEDEYEAEKGLGRRGCSPSAHRT